MSAAHNGAPAAAHDGGNRTSSENHSHHSASATTSSVAARGYADVADEVLASGIGGPLPLPAGKKKAPPTGWTGADAPTPSGADIEEWKASHRDGNCAIRLAASVIGVDADHHRGPQASAALAAYEAAHGALPATWTITSRDDGSGIRLYRLPAGADEAELADLALAVPFAASHVEVIRRGHRYVVAPGSTHPNGAVYRVIGPDGQPSALPHRDDLPQLTPAQHDGLRRPPGTAPTVAPADVSEITDAPEAARMRLAAWDRGCEQPFADACRRLATAPEGTRVEINGQMMSWETSGNGEGGLAYLAGRALRLDLTRAALGREPYYANAFRTAFDAVGEHRLAEKKLRDSSRWATERGPALPRWWDDAVAEARAEKQLGTSPTTPSTSSSRSTAAVTDAGPVMSLTEAHKVFARWLGDDYDLDALDVVLATAAVDRLDGDPLWLLVISGSGNAKTETVQALAGAGATLVSTISSEGALLSATSKKERTKHATGGLLRQLGDRGVLVVKDVTSILSMQRDQRAQVLGALREVYDGRWTRTVGTDGGQTLEWAGRVALVGAVTTAWDKAHAVIASMGDRFVLVRMDSTVHRTAAGRRAIGNTGHETQMRAELAAAAAGVLAGMSTDPVELTDAETDTLLAAADLVTLARTAVETDYRGDVIDVHAPEMPTRFAKQLAQVVRGSVAIGHDRAEGMRLAIRCARDSMPPLRLTLVDDVAAHPDSTTAEIRKRVGLPRATVDRQLQALHMLGVLAVDEEEGMHRGQPVTRWSYRLAAGIEPDALNWHASSARNVSTHPQTPKKEGHGPGDEGTTPRTHTDISGTAPAPAAGGRQHGPVPRVVAGRPALVDLGTGEVFDAEAAS